MKIAFLFAGQGAQYPGMLKDLYEEFSQVREIFEIADSSLERSISQICFKGTQEMLNLTHNTQPCMLAGDLAAAVALKAAGIVPDVAAGFSLGEFAALAFAGVMSLEETFRLIQLRADAMQAAVPAGKGAMAAFIGVPAEQVEAICLQVNNGYVVTANYNSPVQTVISGTLEGVDQACEIACRENIRCMKLAVSAPFHCALMEPAAIELKAALQKIPLMKPQIPIYMNVDGEPMTLAEGMEEKLFRQAVSPVQWVKTLENMQRDGVDTFIECGAGKTISGFVKKTLKGVRILRVENHDTLQKVLKEIF